ncbi:MAG: aminotransferase class I/II-fold pyridoxal phosphate-dependent enzyme [candidate division Zixibacteria bacterium]|nr:aminotransferase class I/II-fold pyridoxal phosphate-dependent enzyme [candidate division Zixibacteria bacterium]
MEQEEIEEIEEEYRGISRRQFVAGALLGAGAISLTAQRAFAQMLATGKTAKDIRGNGVPGGIVQISANENPLGASPRAIDAIMQHIFEINRYSFGSDLPFKLHAHHGITLGVDMSTLDFDDPRTFRALMEKNRVYMDAGSGPIVQLIGLLGVGNGTGECIESMPGYGQIARVFEGFKMAGQNTNVIRVPTTGDFNQDLNAMKAAITPKTTIIAITNPNNPTGTIVPYADLEKFVDSVPKNIIVFIDEAYIHFVREPGYKDAIQLATARDNVVVTRTFSKIYGLAGMRIGYAIASKPILDRMMLHQGFGQGMTVLSSHAASAALEDHDFVTQTIKVTNDGKDFLYGEFKKMGLKYTPSHSNFLIVDVGQDSRKIVTELRKRGVMVRSGWGYQGAGMNPLSNHIRISIGKPDELEVFMNEFKKVMGAAS